MIDRAGQQLGNYRLVRLLGQGGFADVYLGEHVHLKTQAAIKMLQMRLAGDETQGFLAEAQTIAHLDHPHIVRVLDFGIDPVAATPFLVMAYAPNGTLRQRHAKGAQLPPLLVVSYVKQVASALQYAHHQNLIHRDVKPENMLLDRNNNVLLSDFGIALVTQSSRQQSTKDPVGTVSYMAPEQLQGKPSPASDQYALGICVYEWLSGERPFQGSFYELFSQHMMVPPPSLRNKRPDIPADAEQVLFTALAKDPQRRFITIEAFANALEQAFAPTQLQSNPAAYLQNVQGPAIPPPPPVMPHYTPPPPPGLQAYASPLLANPSNPNQPAYTPADFQTQEARQGTPSSPNQPVYPPIGGYQPPAFNQAPSQPLRTPNGSFPAQASGQLTPARSDQALYTPNSGQLDLATVRTPGSGPIPQPSSASSPTAGSFQEQGVPPTPPKRRTSGKLIALISILLVVVIIAAGALIFLPGLLKGNTTSQTAGAGGKSTTATPASNTTPTAGASATPTATPTPGITPTPTSSNAAPGTVLYQANWSKDFDGWAGSTQWKQYSNGTLASDGTSDGSAGKSFFIWSDNFKPTQANYEVDATIQFIRAYNGNNFEFGIAVRGDGNTTGYEVGVGHVDGTAGGICTDAHSLAMVRLVQNDANGKDGCGNFGLDPLSNGSKDYAVDNAAHTYRVLIKDNDITLYIDGTKIVETFDNTIQDAGQVGLRSVFGQINVTSLVVKAL